MDFVNAAFRVALNRGPPPGGARRARRRREEVRAPEKREASPDDAEGWNDQVR